MTISLSSLETCAMRIVTTFMRCVLPMVQCLEWLLHYEVEHFSSYTSQSLLRYAKKIPQKLTKSYRERLMRYRRGNSCVSNLLLVAERVTFITFAKQLKQWKIL